MNYHKYPCFKVLKYHKWYLLSFKCSFAPHFTHIPSIFLSIPFICVSFISWHQTNTHINITQTHNSLSLSLFWWRPSQLLPSSSSSSFSHFSFKFLRQSEYKSHPSLLIPPHLPLINPFLVDIGGVLRSWSSKSYLEGKQERNKEAKCCWGPRSANGKWYDEFFS